MAQLATTHGAVRESEQEPVPEAGTGARSASVPGELPVLLTGATGFVGRHLWPALEGAGFRVRGLTRDARAARLRRPDAEWYEADLDGAGDGLERALTGCGAAYYLVHGMGGGSGSGSGSGSGPEGEGEGFRAREVAAARRFAAAAGVAGVGRIVYLGGVAPAGPPSEHLRSRLEVGETLRAGPVPCLELRASMIVGPGSLSWLMVRDLAARLPAMVLPRWLRSRTQPVAIDDVVGALVGGLRLPLADSASFDLPGPDLLAGRAVLEETARAMGRRPPLVLEVPWLSPSLSSHWVRFVTRADWAVARNLVLGLQYDLVARDASYWERIGHGRPLPFATAARRALAAERRDGPPRGVWGGVERALAELFEAPRAARRPNART